MSVSSNLRIGFHSGPKILQVTRAFYNAVSAPIKLPSQFTGASSVLGINFDANGGASLSGSGFPIFQDKVREARGFTASTNPWSNPVTVDSNGWPTQDFLCLLSEGTTTQGWITSGTFKCGFTGTGTVTAFGACSIANVSTVGGSTTFDLTATANTFGFTVTGTSGTVSNIFAYLPGYAGSSYSSVSLFTTEAINHYKKFSHIRFMDWANTRFNTATMTSSNRNSASNTKTNKAGATTNTADGYPIEWAVDFCNACGNGIYYTMPLNYNVSYLTAAATALSGMNAGVVNYIEPGNELWNFGGGIGGTAYQNVVNAYNTANPGVLNYDSTSDQQTLNARYLAVWLHDIYTQFHSVLGSRMGTDFKIVAAWQTGSAGVFVLYTMLQFLIHQYGSISPYVQMLACAPYKWRDNSQVPGDGVNHTGVNDTIANIESQLTANGNYRQWIANIEMMTVLALHNGLKMMTYEGGWEIGGEGSTPANIGASIMDSGMVAVVDNYLKNEYNAGVSTFTWLAAGVDTGSNNLTPGYKLSNNWSNLTTTGCPRLTGFANYLNNTISYNRNVVSVSGSSFSANQCADYGYNGSSFLYLSSNPTLAGQASLFPPFLGTTGYVPYLVNCTAPGTYSVVVNFTGSGTSDLWCNGVKVTTGASIATGNVTMGVVTLNKGANCLVLGNGTFQNGVTINTLTFN